MKNNKVVLGTANFKKNYGIDQKKIKKSNIKKIIEYSLNSNLKYFDTAINYKNVSKLIGKILPEGNNIITKIHIPKNVKYHFDYMISKIEKSLKEFKVNKFYAVLLHDSENLKSLNNRKILDALKYLKKSSKIKKFGISIYSLDELELYYKFLKPDIIQIPLNLFDQRLLKSRWLKILNKDKVEIHARSIFLQGILLKTELPMRANDEINNHWNFWRKWLKKNKIKPFDACMQFAIQQKKINKFVFGVDSLNQLKQIINYKTKNKINFSSLYFRNEKLLHPQNWRKL